MGEKEMFFLFLITFCLMSFGLQPKASAVDHHPVATIATTDTFTYR